MPAVVGAVYRPLLETVPPVVDHVTAGLLVPLTVAVNCCVPPVCSDAELGLMLTDTAAAGPLTSTVAEADAAVSATLLAMTTYEPAVLGAV